MTWASSRVGQAHRALRELAGAWRPEHIGRWSLPVRLVVLFVCAVLITVLVFVGLFLFAPRISVEEHRYVKTVEKQIRVQRADNLLAAAQQLELERRSIFRHLLVQHNTHELSDIAWTMDVVRTAALATTVQLLSLAPDFGPDLGSNLSPDGHLVIMNLQARLMLSSLPAFWLVLSQAPVDFSISEISLEQAEEPGIFNMRLGLVVPVTATARFSAPATDVARRQRAKKAHPKGFLLRSDSSKFLYLVRDDNGRLRGVE